MPTIGIIFDEGDLARVRQEFAGMKTRAARQEIIPILLEAFQPVVGEEKSILAEGHNETGALSASLKARSGSGDRPGTFSVFSAPLLAKKQLIARWLTGRAQLRAQAARVAGGTWGRRINYAPYAEAGHRWVRRNAKGQLYQVNRPPAKPIHFAAGAVDAKGDEQAEKAADAIMDHVLGATNE